MLRAAILEATSARATNSPWSSVRISDIAEDVGVSRQTIHNEFGTKDDLAQALFAREMLTFQTGLVEAIERAPDFPSAARDALNWLLDTADRHPMLQRMLADARNGVDQTLLPLLTVHADRLVLPLRGTLTQLFDQRWPGTDLRRAEIVVDVVIRWTITKVVMPSDFPRGESIEQIVEMATDAMRGGRVELVAGPRHET